MRSADAIVRSVRPRHARCGRLAVLVVLGSLLPALSAGAQETAECKAELTALDRSFVATMGALLAAGTPAEECVALKNQIDAVAKAVELQMRCRMPGRDVDRFVGTLSASANDFRQVQAQLGCNVPA